MLSLLIPLLSGKSFQDESSFHKILIRNNSQKYAAKNSFIFISTFETIRGHTNLSQLS